MSSISLRKMSLVEEMVPGEKKPAQCERDKNIDEAGLAVWLLPLFLFLQKKNIVLVFHLSGCFFFDLSRLDILPLLLFSLISCIVFIDNTRLT